MTDERLKLFGKAIVAELDQLRIENNRLKARVAELEKQLSKTESDALWSREQDLQ